MAIDMRQFHQTFFEESFEGLTVMEAELLRLEKTACASGQDTVSAT
jgi:two-component system chemotaxis sensor kinase CheA